MTETRLDNRKLLASLSAGMATAFVPQFSQAALTTVGGDGGTGSVTLTNGQSTDLGGVLSESLELLIIGGSYGYLLANGAQRLFPAARSSVSTSGSVNGLSWAFAYSGGAYDGAVFGSDDNWVPGHFNVTGVNGGDLIWGWLQIELNGGGGSFPNALTVLNFTYDDAATDTTAFVKPEGGFSIGDSVSVPEPGTLGLAALALGAAGITRRRRFLKAQIAA